MIERFENVVLRLLNNIRSFKFTVEGKLKFTKLFHFIYGVWSREREVDCIFENNGFVIIIYNTAVI